MKFKMNDLWHFASIEYENYIQWHSKPHLKEAMKHYKEYKERGGKRVHEGLEYYWKERGY